jgi:hypothetical protein
MEWPLLDIPKAIADADTALKDITWYVELLQSETEGTLPTPEDAALLLANVAAIRDMLARAVPAGLHKEIESQQAYEQEEADRYSY